MTHTDVTMVRIYLTEGDRLLDRLLEHLHDREQVMGVTVFRGTAGFGRSGKVHGQSLVDIAFDLPLVVEFFDAPERVEAVLDHIGGWFGPGHIVQWSARVNA
ncbi:DUF190 domain-containing protein [Thiohalorhabdus methylotrophus]|uniref:DUF190 domain-containing protein n=1 Tax=Thiohalorhabdus methylotrophus TaxID=3242694 RepID=A0ABV4TWZ5_9GAMM